MAWVGRVVGVGSRFVVFRNNARFLITSQRPDCPAISHSFAQKLESPGPDRHFFCTNCPAFFSRVRNSTRGPGLLFRPKLFSFPFRFFASGAHDRVAEDVARELLRETSRRFADPLERGDALQWIARRSTTPPPDPPMDLFVLVASAFPLPHLS